VSRKRSGNLRDRLAMRASRGLKPMATPAGMVHSRCEISASCTRRTCCGGAAQQDEHFVAAHSFAAEADACEAK
jgi:hypothetical protein